MPGFGDTLAFNDGRLNPSRKSGLPVRLLLYALSTDDVETDPRVNVAMSVDEQMATPSFRLDGRIALVAGTGDGLGAGAAIALAQAGADLVLIGARIEKLSETAALVHALDRGAEVRQCDVCDSRVIRVLIGDIESIDILESNAGTNIPQSFMEVSDGNLEAILILNVRGAFAVAQASVWKMLELPERKERGGVVIHVSSQMDHVGAPLRSVYCMSKHAMEGLTKAMAFDLAPLGMRVNSICPTYIDTPLVSRLLETTDRREKVISKIPIGRLDRVADVMGAIVYLASPAAAMITGAHLMIDGGWAAQ